MLKIGEVVLGGRPRVALALRDGVAQADVAAALAQGVDVVELRIDHFGFSEPDRVLEEVRRYAGIPVLATIRSSAEGGTWHGAEAARLDLFRALMPQVGAVDIEIASAEILPDVVAAARAAKRTVIGSFHDFEATPSKEELAAFVLHAKSEGVDIVKVACACQDPADLFTLAQFTVEHAAEKVIVIGMGAHGVLSRVFFPALGSLLTYTFLGEATAPGQLNCEQTLAYLSALYPEFTKPKASH